jgi:hypothetical protein
LHLYPSLAPSKPEEPELDDECAICLEQFKTKPPGDTHQFTSLSKTECNHFFHEFCLAQHLAKGMNKNCPLCRYKIEISKIIKISVNGSNSRQNPSMSPPAVNSQSQSHSEFATSGLKNASAIGSVMLSSLSGLALVSLKWGGRTAWRLARSAFNSGVTFSSMTQNQNLVERHTYNIFTRWKKVEKDAQAAMQANKEELSVLLATMNSLPVSQCRYSEESLQRIERNAKLFDEKIKELHSNFKHMLMLEKRKIFGHTRNGS